MKFLKVPDWWDSIRAILALITSTSYCWGVLFAKIPKTELEGLYKLAELALIFYFVLKKRNGEQSENGGGAK